ncbi:hypothetical protein [Klebsiella spallanzanii]|uniref:hypothetical protein n=1 Tax=Klebsiella spallanzanii TaxID=2587528 RepID=UPI00115A5305|nr:hypothetical protein [Klebsiella spallanzanii]VUS64973.1 hypothetical protein SB6419_03905 [Klebsiella spallanzanii]
MNKKYSQIINIVMVVIGIIGMLIYFFSDRKPAITAQPDTQVQQEKEPIIPTETITVAVASRDLTKGIKLAASDFKLKTLTIAQDSNEKSLYGVKNVDNWMIKSDVEANSYIPVSALVSPGSEEYIVMSAKPGSIVYGFSIKNSDSYLFANTKAGEGIDIYLSYHLRKEVKEDGNISVTPTTGTSDAINSKHFKIIMKNKKVLAIQKFGAQVVDTIATTDNPLKKEGYILVELTPDEVKTLKGLDGAKLYIFPSQLDEGDIGIKHSALVGDEGQWPIDNRDILSIETSLKNNKTVDEKVKEYRGEK